MDPKRIHDTTAGAFGKLQRDDGKALSAWHPLIDHLIDVATCFQHLCYCQSVKRALDIAAGRELTCRDVARLTVLVFLHDLGKANSGFQSKRWTVENRPPGWPRPAGHGTEAIRLFTEDALAPFVEELPIDTICTWGDAVDPLLIASISHHGRPVMEDASDWNPAIWKPVSDPDGRIVYDPQAVLRQIGRRVQAIFPEAFESGGEPLPSAPAFGHIFAGLVQLADWLGSDTRFFKYTQDGENRAETALKHARQAVLALGLDATSWRSDLTGRSPTFQQIFDIDTPYPIQAAMDDSALGPLVILESETGSGKTEAALWRYVHLFRTGKVDSLYFALPTRVSATQVYRRILDAVRHLWPEDPPVTVRALPGYAGADNHEATALPDFKVLWSDQPDDAVAHRRWAAESPKRYLAAPIAVGTIDQALLGILRVRHAHLRHALLSRSLLVVDEVHASDAYMTVLLERLLKAHLNWGGQALLLSATLGSSARDRYLALSGDGPGGEARFPSFAVARDTPYPALSDNRGLRPVASTARPKPVTWDTVEVMDAPEQIAGLALDAAGTGAKVLVIRNTVPAAVAVQKAVEERVPDPRWLFTVNGIATVHHSRFSRQDRPILDAAVEAAIGKQRPGGPCIVIGSQTLEQSLDLDADLLITDLCPMDVLLQRIGRLHRHHRPAEERPDSFHTAQVRVLVPRGGDLGPLLGRPRHGLGRFHDGGGVYPDLRIAEATRRLIRQHPTVSIPADNRYLVEAATHPERLHEIQQTLGQLWPRLGQQVEGDRGARQTVARLQTLDMNANFGEQGFPDDVRIATRLGIEDRLVHFEPPLPGPFGEPLRQLPIRQFLLPAGLDPDLGPSYVVAHDGVVDFMLGTTRFRYGRFGLERMQDD